MLRIFWQWVTGRFRREDAAVEKALELAEKRLGIARRKLAEMEILLASRLHLQRLYLE